MIVNQFDLFNLAEQMLGMEVIIPCNCISRLSTKESNVFEVQKGKFYQKS